MAKFKSIVCPKKNDHKFEKFLLFVDGDGLYVYCKDHSWIKIIFKKGNKKINFEDTAVVLEPMGENFHFEAEPMPVLALGKFHLKQKTWDKRHAKSK